MAAWQAVLFALFTWYFSTGVILYLDGLPARTFRWSLLGASLVLLGALYGLNASRNDLSPAGAYCSFACGVLAWAWQEVAFLMGFVTGPNRRGSLPGSTGWRHFQDAVGAVLYHELAIVAGAGAVLAASWGGANQVGVWTFVVLWAMRQSAKFNIFLGVRNLSLEFLPPHLDFLKGYMTRKPMNVLFPASVTAGTVAAYWLVQRAAAAEPASFTAAELTFLATMTVLGLAEHWFLVVPLPFAQLWRWGLRSHQTQHRDIGAPYPSPTPAP